MTEYAELKREIDDTEAIIFALKASIKYAETQCEYDTYLEEIAFRERELEELKALIIN